MAERIFERKIYQKMLDWKRDSNGKTALLIKGARRVGKSTIAEEFAKKGLYRREIYASATAPFSSCFRLN